MLGSAVPRRMHAVASCCAVNPPLAHLQLHDIATGRRADEARADVLLVLGEAPCI